MNIVDIRMDFMNEDFFKKIFKKNKINKKELKKELEVIIDFLKDNNINNWSDIQNMKGFDKEIMDRLLNNNKSKDYADELRFRLRVNLSDKKQLKQYIKELEFKEEYEKCAYILKKITKR